MPQMKIFVDRLHSVLFLDLAIKQYPKFSGPPACISLFWPRKIFPLIVPKSRVTMLQSLISYGTTYHPKSSKRFIITEVKAGVRTNLCLISSFIVIQIGLVLVLFWVKEGSLLASVRPLGAQPQGGAVEGWVPSRPPAPDSC